MLQNVLILILLLCCHVAVCQYKRDYFVFTVHLTCTIKQKKNFSYRLAFWEKDTLNPDDQMTPYDNIGNATDGHVVANNFAKFYGDAFLNKEYEIYAKIYHDCTRSKSSYRMITEDLGDCEMAKRYCNRKIVIDVTEKGEKIEKKKDLFKPNEYSFDVKFNR